MILLSLAATNPPTYRKAIHSAGGTPIGGYLPECETPDSFDGLLLGGGGDLDPNWYGEVNRASDTLDHRRDELEHELIKKAIALEIPILGICRGIQILTGMLGGTLIQDLGVVHSMTEESYRLHAAYAKAGSRIETLYGKSIVINSGHHQAVKRLAPGFIATQWSCDGVIGTQSKCVPPRQRNNLQTECFCFMIL